MVQAFFALPGVLASEIGYTGKNDQTTLLHRKKLPSPPRFFAVQRVEAPFSAVSFSDGFYVLRSL